MFLRKVDMLSPKITLYYKQKNTHASVISGILTIIVCTLIITFATIYFVRYANKENPTAYFYNRYIDDIGTFSFSENHFFNFVQLVNGRSREIIEIDFDKLEIIGINSTFNNYYDGGNNQSHWIYGKCDKETDISNIEHLINNETFYKSACLKRFYNKRKNQYYEINDKNNFEWPSIQHGASHINTTFFGVIIRKCTNSSFRNCSSERDINNYLNNSHLSFNIIDHYVDILNYKNPITKFLYSITNGLTHDSYTTNNLNFNPGIIKTYDNLFKYKPVEKTSYFFNQNEKTTTISENTNILCAFYIWMQNTQQYYERRYQKLQDALSDIGGIANLFLIIAQCINYLIARYNMLIDTQTLLTNIIKKNISIYENLIKSHNPRKFINLVNIQKKDEDISSLKIFESSNNIKKIINSENLNIKKEENKNIIISHKINIINKNNLGEETKREQNEENIEQKKTKEKKVSENINKLKRMSTRKYINRDFALINEKDKFNCFGYFFYIIFCKKINSNIKYYEELRRLIISEECMIQNYLNIYKLLEIQNIT